MRIDRIYFSGTNEYRLKATKPMDHSADTIIRDWKIISAYVIIGYLVLFAILFTSPQLMFYVTIGVGVLGAVILVLSR